MATKITVICNERHVSLLQTTNVSRNARTVQYWIGTYERTIDTSMTDEKTTLFADAVELMKRHGALHTVNIKYGYIIFGLSALFILVRTLSIWYYQRAWKRSGRSTTVLRVTSLPLPLSISLIVLTVAILVAVKPHLEKITVVVKRLGRLAYALIPLDIFLAAQPAWFSVDNYLNTIQMHKWVSRVIVLLGMFHSIGFLAYYVSMGTVGNLFRPVNFLGFLMFIFANIMFVFWKPIRNLNYTLFYLYHNFFMLALVVMIYFHARPGVGLYFFFNAMLLVAQAVRKYTRARDVTLTEIIENPGSNLLIVKFPKSLLPESYLPGCHVRIGYSKWTPFFTILPSHPYTVATSFENRDLLASLVIKKTKFKLEPFETYSIQPSFESSLSQNFFDTADNVNIVCGGSGISLGLVIFEYLKRSIISGGREIKLKFVWITKDEEDVFILQELNVQGVDVFITNNTSYELDSIQESAGIPLTELSNDSHDSLVTIDHKFSNTVVVGKRPDLEKLLQNNLSKTIDYANKWIISCGPPSLIEECSKISTKQKCRFFSEEYAF